jgi:spermidine/putrescine ABC transporter ATP-binding subunit
MLKVEQLSRSFGKIKALDKVSLEIPDESFFALLGPSGCGKTTLLRILAGLELPDAGRILWRGEDVTDVPAQLRPFNTVFQSYALFPHMSVMDNVEFGLRVKGIAKTERRKRALDVLKLVQMDSFQDSRVTKLSGGQQQRVALARALVNEPQVLLLDEPLSALDLKLRRGMQRELMALHRRVGLTFVLVTHDQEEAMSMASNVAILNGGRVLQYGTPRDLYESPADRFVANFFGETNSWTGQVQTNAGLDSEIAFAADHTDFKMPLRRRGDLEVGQKAEYLVRPHRIEVHLRPVQPEKDTCQVTGKVVLTTFKGDSWDIEVEWAANETWTASVPVAASQSVPPVGDTVYLTWSAEAAVVVPL